MAQRSTLANPQRRSTREDRQVSPDDGDALALTFAYPVAKRDWTEERRFEEVKRWIR